MSDMTNLAPVEGEVSSVQAYRSTLEGLSPFDVVEAIAVEDARIAASEARRLIGIAVLNSLPCMVPSPPHESTDPASGNRRSHRPKGLRSEDLPEAEIMARLRLDPSRAHELVRTSTAMSGLLPKHFRP